MNNALNELIDFEKNQHLLDGFCQAVGIAAAIIDLEGKTLVESRWQRVCTNYHRVHPTTFRRCRESDTRLANELLGGKRFSLYRCNNGLTDAASPIIIEDQHLANVFVGQFFLSPPDTDFFRRQVREFGFDEEAYLAAVAEVPIIAEEKLPAILNFLCGFAEMVASMGLERLRQMEMQEAVLTSEERFRTLVANIPGTVFRCEVEVPWRMEHISEAVLALTGYPADDFLGKRQRAWAELIVPEDLDLVRRKVAEAVEGRNPYIIEYRIRRADGEVRWVHERGRAAYDGAGRALWCDGMVMDITDRKQGDELRVQLEEQLLHSQKMEALGTLAGGVAHDFNNLLTVILGNVDLIEGYLPAGSAAQSCIDTVREASQQAAGVTRSLLTFSRKMPTEKKTINLCEVVDKTARMLRRVLPASVDLAIDTSCVPAPWIHADETQIQQVVMNLAINARDAMPSGGTLRISVTRKRSDGQETSDDRSGRKWQARLTISDTGAGIPPAVLSRLFEPFFTTKARGQGTGLGLAVIHGIVQEHKGHIDVKSRVGRGSTFTVQIPCVGESTEEQGPVSEADSYEAGHGTVLVAEDNPQVSSVIRTTLEMGGFDVIQVGDGPSLLEAAERQRQRMKLLIVDVDIPGRNGLDCLKDLRRAGNLTPALVITGSVAPDVEQRLDEDTMLLRKPFQVTVLRKIAADLIRGQRGQPADGSS